MQKFLKKGKTHVDLVRTTSNRTHYLRLSEAILILILNNTSITSLFVRLINWLTISGKANELGTFMEDGLLITIPLVYSFSGSLGEDGRFKNRYVRIYNAVYLQCMALSYDVYARSNMTFRGHCYFLYISAS